MGKVYIVDSKYDAKYKVWFCNSRFDEKNAQLIKGCKLVKNKYEADIKVFIVNSKYDADIIITRENFPS